MKTKNAALKIRDFAFEVKADDLGADGTFSGYASVFGVVDSYNEVVAPKAFRESLKDIKATKRPLPALWQHRTAEPIGYYSELAEDETGLRVAGRLLVEDVPRAKEAHALMKAGVVSGLSIGYLVRDAARDEKTGIVTLKKLDLMEVSIVTFPANDASRIDAVKYKLARGYMPTIREFEGILREQGFSKSQAAIIANHGFKHLAERGTASEDDTANGKGLLEVLSGISFK